MLHKALDEQLLNPNFITSAVDTLMGPDEDKAFHLALFLLDINRDAYANIHSVEFKKDFLLYKFLCAEFKTCKEEYSAVESQLQLAFELAYQKVLNSALTNQVKTAYSAFSYGLSELDLRTVRSSPKKSDESLGQLDQSVIAIGQKKHGIEPGFEAIHTKDVLFQLYKKYPNKEMRLAIIKSASAEINSLYDQLKSELPKYLVKLDYKEIKDDRIVVDKEDLKRAKTLKYFYAKGEVIGDVVSWIYQQLKSVPSAKKNVEAVLEALANDVARLFMPVQKQTLYQGKFENGLLKLMLKAEWIEGATTLAPIAGGVHDDQYCVTPVVNPMNGITHISDQSIKHLAEKLALLIVQNDRDAIGSQAQNKLRRGNEFFGIDFGHAYQSATSLVDALTDDFHIQDPSFKNYSVFYDAPRSEIVRGLIKLAALAGHKFDETVLQSYGSDFATEIKAILPHSDEKIFDDYILKFKELSQQFSESDDRLEIKTANIKCCQKIVKKVAIAKERHIAERDRLIKRFGHYLSLNAEAVDLVENFEKLCTPPSKISLRSPDGTVLLRHLRVADANRAKWQVKVGYEGQHSLVGQFQSEQLAEEAVNAIQSMIPAKTEALMSIERKGKNVNLSFDKKYLPYLCNIFSETKMMKKYCAADYELLLTCKEQALQPLENELLSLHKIVSEFNASNSFLQLTLNYGLNGGILHLANESKGSSSKQKCIEVFLRHIKSQFIFDELNSNFLIPNEKMALFRELLTESCGKFQTLQTLLKVSTAELGMMGARTVAGVPSPSDVQSTAFPRKPFH